MNISCPNSKCMVFQKNVSQKRDGFFLRKDDGNKIQRYQCKICLKKYSSATFEEEYRQTKRRVNTTLLSLLASGISINRSSLILNIHPETVARKLQFLAKKARAEQVKFLEKISENKIMNVQIDDLITSVHSKLKPLSVSVVIDSHNRYILGIKTSEISAFGKLAAISKKKYGKRQNLHRKTLDQLLKDLTPFIDPKAIFKTDKHKTYSILLKKNFPQAIHKSYKGMRAAVVGQGELKTKNYDPIFMANHTLAMLRANINRLFRRTWCTTKKEARLQDHLDLFTYFFNQLYL